MLAYMITILFLFFCGFNISVYLIPSVSHTMQLYARRHFLFPPLSIEEHNDRVMAVVRCETQVSSFVLC